ncbi:MAG: hypothetical protein AAF501_02430 [Pseudomonadota bacterium]
MTDGRFIADTLESVLAGMAESLREAQEELNAAAPIDAYGRPAPQFRIPHLDFEIGFRLVSEEKSGGGARLFFAPVQSSEASKEVTSTISGRFIAVPAGEGLPLPVLTGAVTQGNATNVRTVAITAANNAGELLEGAEIELNIDEDATQALSAAAGVTAPRIGGNVSFGAAVISTGPSGVSTTTVTLGAQLQRQAVVVIAAELGAETIRLTLGKDVAT